MYDLEIGDEIVIFPKEGEQVAQTLARLKLRAAKWGRAYRMKVSNDPEGVVVQRIAEDHAGSASDWFMMPVGSTLLLKTHPTAADVAKAKRMASYLTNTGSRRRGVRRRYGQWQVLPVIRDQLLIWCQVNESLEAVPETIPDRPPPVEPRRLWAGDWP